MPTSWKRADGNALRAYLQEALAQRAETMDPRDWSYSDYEVAAIRAELNERQIARAAGLESAATACQRTASSNAEFESCQEPQSEPDPDPDAVRLRMLIARCFRPSSKNSEQRLLAESAMQRGQRPGRDAPIQVFARLQRLR